MTQRVRRTRIYRWCLILLSLIGVCIATFVSLFLVTYYVLWGCVFGDNADPSKYALALAISASPVISAIFLIHAVAHEVGNRFLILVSIGAFALMATLGWPWLEQLIEDWSAVLLRLIALICSQQCIQ